MVSWRQRQKQKIVFCLGGRCVLCGYKTTARALEAHHVHPEHKSFSISDKNTRSWARVMRELDKCVLLCSNCHAEYHDGLVDMSTLSEILRLDLPRRGRRAETIIKDSHLTRNTPASASVCACGRKMSRTARSCRTCYNAHRQTAIDWPPHHRLASMVDSLGFEGVGRRLGVSGNAVRKRLKRSMG